MMSCEGHSEVRGAGLPLGSWEWAVPWLDPPPPAQPSREAVCSGQQPLPSFIKARQPEEAQGLSWRTLSINFGSIYSI